MAGDIIWQGGASTTAQVDTVQLWTGTWTGDGNITTTITLEDGTNTQTVVTATTNADQTAQRDAHLAALQASGQSMFQRCTWASSGADSFTMTVKAAFAGIPIKQATTDTDTAGSIASDTSTTPNSGPNDVGTAANYNTAAIPVQDDELQVMPHPSHEDGAGAPKSYSMLYGLAQGINLRTFYSAPAFRGSIGDPVNRYPLQYDCTYAGGGDGNTVLKSSGLATLLKGTHTAITLSRARGGRDSFYFDGTVTTARLLGPDVAGTITFADASAITTLYGFGCAGANVKVGTSNTITDFRANAGTWQVDKAITAAITGGNVYVVHTAGAVPNWDHYGGTVIYRGSGDLGTTGTDGLTLWSGVFDFTQQISQAGITVYNAVVYNGRLVATGGLGNVTFNGGITVHGGSAEADAGVSVAYT